MHLKRVRKSPDGALWIIVAPTAAVQQDQPDGSIETALARLDLGHCLVEITTTAVCARPPLTREQFEAANALWPTSYHEAKEVMLAVDRKLFSPAQCASFAVSMARAMRLADNQAAAGGVRKAGVAVVSGTEEVVASAVDARHKQPLRHCAMELISNVAATQRNLSQPTEGKAGYLFNGMDVFLTHEPCPMCAMALLHSRVARVFYQQANQATGSLGTVHRLHTNTKLNHKFQVFRRVLE